MTSINSMNSVNLDKVSESSAQGAQKEQETNSVWSKYDTDGSGTFSKGDDLYIGIEREISYRKKHNLGSDLTNQLEDLLNSVGKSFDVINNKIKNIYEKIYGNGDFSREAEAFMNKRAEMAQGKEDEVFQDYKPQK